MNMIAGIMSFGQMYGMLKEYGVQQYHIFLDRDSGAPFAVVWREYMVNIMKTNENNNPLYVELKNVIELL